jgi:hypothetical protein
VEILVLKPVFVRWVATELLALLFGECVTEGYFCHRFSHIFEGAYPRIAEEVFCLCPFLRSSSDLVVGPDWALEALTKTLPLGSLRSVPVVIGQHACSPSLHVLDVWLVAQVERRAVGLGQQWVLLVDSAHNSVEFYVPLPLVIDNPLGRHVAMQRAVEQVLEKVEVVSQLSMELPACMVR